MKFVQNSSPILLAVCWLLFSTIAHSQSRIVSDVDRRAGPPNTLQKPIAFEIGDYTAESSGILFGGGDAWRIGGFYGGRVDVNVVNKLPNTIAYGVNGRFLFSGTEDEFDTEGRFDVFIRNYLGEISYGNYDDRNTLALSASNTLSGEANLFFDGFFNPSTERAFRFRSRVSSFLIDMAIDDDGDSYNGGFLYRRAGQVFKHAFSLHYNGGDFLDRYNRNGLTLGHQLSYGSFDLIVGGAWDQFDPYANFASFDRFSGSVGASWKRGVTTFSAGSLLAKTNNGPLESLYSLGVRVDLMRGLSLNGGYIFGDSKGFGTDGLAITDGELEGLIASLAYRF